MNAAGDWWIEVPMPEAKTGCARCGVLIDVIDLSSGGIVLSPTGRVHYGAEFGQTACGIDATGDGWWWPL